MRFYEANLDERHKGQFHYYAHWNSENDRILLTQNMKIPGMRIINAIYTNRDLTPLLDRKVTVDHTTPGEPATFFKAMDYQLLASIGVRVTTFNELTGAYTINIIDPEFYEDDLLSYCLFEIRRGDVQIVKSVEYVGQNEPTVSIFSAEKKIEENLTDILSLPHVKDLPEPLRSIVYEQYNTTYGMLFIENDAEFRKSWNKEKLGALSNQISSYNLDTYIVMPKDPEDAFQIENGEAVITAYCGLSSKFNFV